MSSFLNDEISISRKREAYMNRINHLIAALCIATSSLSSAQAQPSSATCASSSGRSLCVRFDNAAGAPQLNSDFSVTFDGSNIPRVSLLIGANGGTTYEWRVWCKDGSDNPQPINSITTPNGYNYKVKLAQPDGTAGATNLVSADLHPSGDHYSSLLSGSKIDGNLTGNLTLYKTSGGSGGEIDGLIIYGDVGSGSTITVPVLTDMTIYGSVDGTLNNTGSVSGLAIGDSGVVTGQINLGQMDNSQIYCFAPIEGDLSLSDDIDADSNIQLNGDVSCTATIDLNGHDVAGSLKFFHTLSGQVIEGGTISGDVVLAYGSGVFEGSVTFDNVTDTGQIRTTHYNDLDGTIHIDGDVDGDIHHFGSMTSTGSIDIGGNLAGDISITADVDAGGQIDVTGQLIDTGRIMIDGSCDGAVSVGSDSDGTITVGDDLSGDIVVHGAMSGPVTVGDELESGGLISVIDGMKGNGFIGITGVTSGTIDVQQPMTDLSAVKATGGLASGGLVNVNSQGNSSTTTEGTIWIGGRIADLPFTIPYAGAVRINCGSSSATFSGVLKIVGCAATSAQTANVCIYGTNSGTTTVYSSGCTYAYATGCSGSCP
jgi:cytoskeletal protein CcmA (bactofilin family)